MSETIFSAKSAMCQVVHNRHCDEVFVSRECAEDHFGRTEHSDPACQIKGAADFYLVRYIRQLEARLRSYENETDCITVAWEAKCADHVQELKRAEEAGYNKGVQDMKKLGVVVA